MNKNMRKMYTEEEIVALAQKHISGGTKLYRHAISRGYSVYLLLIHTNTQNNLY